MQFILNEQPQEIDLDALTVETMLKQQGIAQREGIAVALDLEIIPKSDWGTRLIEENQKVLIITATQGG